MKNRKLKAFVLPSVYVATLMVIFVSIMFMSTSLFDAVDVMVDSSDYVINVVEPDDYPVVGEVESKPSVPFVNETVVISKDYYSKDDESNVQEGSLIYYKDTYMQNTGILYNSVEAFDVLSVMDGTVKNVTEDEILGICIEIVNSDNISTYYYSLSEVNVKAGDVVRMGDILAKAGTNKLDSIEGNSLLFEVYYKGKTMDPNTFYESNIKDLN